MPLSVPLWPPECLLQAGSRLKHGDGFERLWPLWGEEGEEGEREKGKRRREGKGVRRGGKGHVQGRRSFPGQAGKPPRSESFDRDIWQQDGRHFSRRLHHGRRGHLGLMGRRYWEMKCQNWERLFVLPASFHMLIYLMPREISFVSAWQSEPHIFLRVM